MTTLILAVVGSDRPGLVAAVADVVDAHGGNWERSQLAELSGVFAGVIEVSVQADRAADLETALRALDNHLTVTVLTAADSASTTDSDFTTNSGSTTDNASLTVQILGNDRPGIVREVSAVFNAHRVNIDDMTTTTRDAAMAGGRLFEASVTAGVPASVDLDRLRADLEQLATEIQVDITVAS